MMQFGFCDLAVVPVRREPSDMAELSTQLLFGDIVEISGQTGSWLRIRNDYDDYEGWIDEKQVREIEREEFERLKSLPLFVNRNLFATRVLRKESVFHLPAGCSFYDVRNGKMHAGGIEYRIDGEIFPFRISTVDLLIGTAMEYFSCPYLWGGKTAFGIDCSGLTQIVFKQHGIKLLRDAAQQSTQGELVNFRSESRPGDLAFFDNTDGKIVHTGIILDQERILHCSGRVRIDLLDHQGIYNRDLERYTHSLRLIRRMA